MARRMVTFTIDETDLANVLAVIAAHDYHDELQKMIDRYVEVSARVATNQRHVALPAHPDTSVRLFRNRDGVLFCAWADVCCRAVVSNPAVEGPKRREIDNLGAQGRALTLVRCDDAVTWLLKRRVKQHEAASVAGEISRALEQWAFSRREDALT